ncbi:hypothetical protein [Maribacter sp. 2-571]|uniref:hypothetical protein n=1 Tax=Maribacter sp. 2-571 TaxID=3417569 RepID=UPI003D33FFF5
MKNLKRISTIVLAVIFLYACSKEDESEKYESAVTMSTSSLNLTPTENTELTGVLAADFEEMKKGLNAVFSGKMISKRYQILGTIPSSETIEQVVKAGVAENSFIATGDYAKPESITVDMLGSIDPSIAKQHRSTALTKKSLNKLAVGDIVLKLTWQYRDNDITTIAIGNPKKGLLWESMLSGLYTVETTKQCDSCADLPTDPMTGKALVLKFDETNMKSVKKVKVTERGYPVRRYCHTAISMYEWRGFWGSRRAERIGWAWAQLTTEHDRINGSLLRGYANSGGYMENGDIVTNAEITAIYTDRAEMSLSLGLSKTPWTLAINNVESGVSYTGPRGGEHRVLNSGLTRLGDLYSSCRSWRR